MAQPLKDIEGKYEIVGKLHEGGMGAVYEVRHRLLDVIRVVKVLRPRFASDDELRARFLAEARAAIRLRHPNVVQVHDFTLDDDGVGLIVMEHIDGVDLRQLRALSLPSLPLALEVARQSLRALAYLHRRGFVHRDVSPDNLMLTRDADDLPLVKVIDLGIAKDRRSELHLTESGVFLGKFRYASPEHFAAEDPEHIEARSDLYSLGVVLYELFTGHHPIRGTETASLIAGHLFRPIWGFDTSDPAGRLPQDLRDLLTRALAKSPADRFSDAPAMADALAPILARFPLDEAARAESLDRIAHRPASVAQPTPGSTQERIDIGFDLAATPSPSRRIALEGTVPGRLEILEHKDPFDRHVSAGCMHAAEGDFAAAIAAFEAALAVRPESAAVQLLIEEARSELAHRDVSRDDGLDPARMQLAAGNIAGAIECILDAANEENQRSGLGAGAAEKSTPVTPDAHARRPD